MFMFTIQRDMGVKEDVEVREDIKVKKNIPTAKRDNLDAWEMGDLT